MWNIVIGVLFIIGGLSGEMAVRGTDSTIGLAVIGAVLLLWGIYQMVSTPAEPTTTKSRTRKGKRPGTAGRRRRETQPDTDASPVRRRRRRTTSRGGPERAV